MLTLVHKADCGCGFSKGDSFYMCAMHKAAPDLLAALEELTSDFAFSKEVQRCFGDALERLERYRNLIAKAKAGKG